MVEKIIINPNKVRGYGNIINQHTTTDYTNYACTLTEETDTINGQTMPVYEMEDTILFFDKATATNHTDHWADNSSGGSITHGDNGTKIQNGGSTSFYGRTCIPLDKTASSTYQYSWNAPLVIEFDLVDTDNTTNNNDGQFQIYSSTTSSDFSTNLYSNYIGHWRVELHSDNTQKVYCNGAQIRTGSYTLTDARIVMRTKNSKYITYKNFKIYVG